MRYIINYKVSKCYSCLKLVMLLFRFWPTKETEIKDNTIIYFYILYNRDGAEYHSTICMTTIRMSTI